MVEKENVQEIETKVLDETEFNEGDKTVEDIIEDKNPIIETETETEKVKQSKEQNAKYAELRRKQESEKAYLKGKLAASEKNTFTGEPIVDEADLEIFELQKAIEKDGGDPNDIGVVAKYLANKKREEIKTKQEEFEKTEKLQKMATEDRDKFQKLYPKENILDIANDPKFLKFCGKRFGQELTADLYTEYLDLQEILYEKFKKEQASEFAKKQNIATSGGDKKVGTNEPVQKEMTYEELRGKYNY